MVIFAILLYAIIDIEATGGNSKIGRITEVAIYKFDGNKIVDQFVSLVNPERSIPIYVQRLTGIADSMVEKAPKFYEIAKSVIEITENCTFVAHNVKFDYTFIQAELASLGYEYKRDRLCTLQLSQRILPELPAHGLGKLCKSLEIKINDRHRASGDALATVELFKLLQKSDQNNLLQRLKRKA